jgi:hypothetical protein
MWRAGKGIAVDQQARPDAAAGPEPDRPKSREAETLEAETLEAESLEAEPFEAEPFEAKSPEAESLAARLESLRRRYENDEADDIAELTLPLVEDYARVLGSGHRDTLQARFLHAQCAAYRYKFTERLRDEDGTPVETDGLLTTNRIWDELVADCESALGADDPDTLKIREARTAEYCELSLHVLEAAGYAALAAARSRILGPEHPESFETLIQQAVSLRECGAVEDSRKLCAEGVAGLERTLGAEHPRTRDAFEWLESWPGVPETGAVAHSSEP